MEEKETNSLEESKQEEEKKQEIERKYKLIRDAKRKKIKKGISLVAATVVLAGGITLYIFHNNIKVRFAKTSEIEKYAYQDDAMREESDTSVLENTIATLTKIEDYLKVSNTLNELNQKYSTIISLSCDPVSVEENKLVSISEEEYLALCTDLEMIDNCYNETDEFYQAVQRAVSCSYKLNAWLCYDAKQEIYQQLLDNLQNDCANSLNIDFSKITVLVNENSNTICLNREADEENNISYHIIGSGSIIEKIKNILIDIHNDLGSIDNFMQSSQQNGEISVLEHDDEQLLYHKAEDQLAVYRNENIIKELEEYSAILKMLICRSHSIQEGKFSYQILIPNDIPKITEIEENSSLSLKKIRKI